MRSSASRAYSLLFFWSGATGLVYELLWVRVLYQTFGSTIQSVTTVVAAYMGGLGLGAWLLGNRADGAQPDEPVWTTYTAAILLGLGDTTFADSALARVLRRGESRDALLLSGLVALRRGHEARARALLGQALTAGGRRARRRFARPARL